MRRPTLPAAVAQREDDRDVRIAGLLLRACGMAAAMSAATVLWIEVVWR